MTTGDLLLLSRGEVVLSVFKEGVYFLSKSLVCLPEGMLSVVSLSRKQSTSPVMIMISRSRLGIRKGQEVGNIKCAG